MEKGEKTLHDRLVAIQSGLKAPKDQYNSFGKYKYRSAEGILEAVKPLLKANNCKLTIMDEVVLIGDRYYVKAIATISDGTQSLSVSALAREADTKAGMDASQITGAASSYARKYCLSGLLAIDDNKDADALNNSPEYTAPEPKPEPKKAPAKAVKPSCPGEVWAKLVKMDVEGMRTKSGLTGKQYLQTKYAFDGATLQRFDAEVQMGLDAKEADDFLALDESRQNPKNK